MTLDPNIVVVASRNQMGASVGGETIVLEMVEGHYYGLNDVGARIWQLVQTPTAVADIRDVLLTEYEVDASRCEADVMALIDRMLAARLVEACPAAGAR